MRPVYQRDDPDCDISFHTDSPNGRCFHAHTSVICSASNFFHSMCHGQWLESRQDVIRLRGITDNTLDTLLSK